ncbi:MAG: transposase [Proteobacteria bacterium]|nr:transposase [Pseudomonadota bacterium]
MTTARKQLISITDTPYYHVVTRCVRRAFLAGYDKPSKTDFGHRRQWIVDRMMFLCDVFAIDICSYSVMSNHYHIVLKVSGNKIWTTDQTLKTWNKLYNLPYLCEKYLRGEIHTKAEQKQVKKMAKKYRKRLMNISWFMKCLNEYIAVKANAEDNVKGHFWESRFKSQALLDERALLTCMAYVDLNPIRAAMAQTPETSDYTSIQARIKNKTINLLNFMRIIPDTYPQKRADVKILSRRIFGDKAIPYYLSEYIALIHYTGKCVHPNKRGYISDDIPDILNRLKVEPDTWVEELKQFKTDGITAVGTVTQLKAFCQSVKKKFSAGFQIPTLE